MALYFNRTILVLVISFLSITASCQVSFSMDKIFKKAVKALAKEEYQQADSLFTILINLSPDAATFVNRAITRKALGDAIGYCKDLESASYKGDEEAEKVLIKDCCFVDTLYRDDLFSELKPEGGRYKVLRIRNRATQKVSEKLFDTNGELFYRMNIHNEDTSILGPGVQMAEFPGGSEAFYKYLEQNLSKVIDYEKYDGLYGVVYCSFVVEKDGSITNAKIIRGVSEDFDDLVLSVIEKMPNWTPTQIDGREFKQGFNLPVRK